LWVIFALLDPDPDPKLLDYSVSELYVGTFLLVGHGLEKLHHDVRIHFELELLLRVAHDLPTVLHDELNGGVAKALQNVLHGKEERVHGVLRLDRLCVGGTFRLTDRRVYRKYIVFVAGLNF
jgi:hypothetical protein